jgi:hypothetical protein
LWTVKKKRHFELVDEFRVLTLDYYDNASTRDASASRRQFGITVLLYCPHSLIATGTTGYAHQAETRLHCS